MKENKYLLVSRRLHNLNPYGKTLMEAPESLSEKHLFLSMFFDEFLRMLKFKNLTHING